MKALLIAALMMISSVGSAEKEKVVVLTNSSAELLFLDEARKFILDSGMVPIAQDELNAFFEAEKIKDLVGCDEISCYSEIIGAYGIRFVSTIRLIDKEVTIRIHDVSDGGWGAIVARRKIQTPPNKDNLQSDIDDFLKSEQKILSIAKRIPCNFPWSKVEGILGKPHSAGNYASDKKYFGIEFTVFDGMVVWITYKGSYILNGCR